jgi:CheY-like chemotaxis protein
MPIRRARGLRELGLGLALARRLVETHGDAILAESSGDGQGATFAITLPSRSGRRTTTEMHAVEIKKALNANEKSDLDGVHVLVVDDEADARDLTAIRLQQYGAEVVTAATVEAAMEILAQQQPRPDLIVSDIAMPGEEGYSVMRRVRALDPAQGGRIPSIAAPAYNRTKDLIRALAAGFQAHLPKPVNAVELAHVITGLIGRFNRYQWIIISISRTITRIEKAPHYPPLSPSLIGRCQYFNPCFSIGVNM